MSKERELLEECLLKIIAFSPTSKYLIDEIESYLSEPEWKPIDEAPTDGTVIEAWEWNPSSEKWCHYDCFWGEYDEIYVVDEDNGWIADSWGYPVHPTHWRELPEPPEVNHE